MVFFSSDSSLAASADALAERRCDPTKLGFKNPKSLVALGVTNTFPGGYWADQGYNWFSGS